jgi:hypothetical protein
MQRGELRFGAAMAMAAEACLRPGAATPMAARASRERRRRGAGCGVRGGRWEGHGWWGATALGEERGGGGAAQGVGAGIIGSGGFG